ncbi:hypothetical protein [Rothia endophytica]|uniref:hypothetical protein n=1 Tax=Rothia endophytica TaxID=1324766 RepID=UPI001F3E4802|nr:hypothetical protein [Rothia endophytica]
MSRAPITSSFEEWDTKYPIINFERTFTCGHTAVFTNRLHKFQPYQHRAEFADRFAATTECWDCRQAKLPPLESDPVYVASVKAAVANLEVFELPMLEDDDPSTLMRALKQRDALLVQVVELMVSSPTPSMSEDEFESDVLVYARKITDTKFWASPHLVWVTEVSEYLQATAEGRELVLNTRNDFNY